MAELTMQDMQRMQKTLQQKYFEKWGGLSPEMAIQKLLWLHGELGEASDVIKKNGDDAILEDGEIRRHFIEEMCDVMMYFNDVLICYGITPEEFAEIYVKKYDTNMSRW